VKTISTDEALNCVGLHSNGHTLVAGGMFGSILVYDLRSPNKPTNKLIGH
jgi:WD40 repeat protein